MKVRIAVAVSGLGDWCAGGWTEASEEDMRRFALDGADSDDAALHWITVDVPLPVQQELAGEVEK